MAIEPTGPRGRERRTKSEKKKDRTRKDKQEDDHAGRKTSEDPPIDWAAIKASALKRMTSGPWGETQADVPSREGTTEQARGSMSPADAVQEAIAELHALLASGGELPAITEEITALVVERAQRRWKAWCKRAGEQRKNLELIGRTLTPRELFDEICANDERKKLFTRLFEALEDRPEARKVLYLVLNKGFLFHETQLMAEKLKLHVDHITNIKRCIVRHAERIMRELRCHEHTRGRP